MKTLVVGIDAACSRVLDPLIEAGAVPRIEKLLETGASAPLESQIPPWTASAWPSIYTGMNPGTHGVFDFLTFSGYDWDVINATHVRAPAIWEILDTHGLSSVVLNVPVTDPPAVIDGAIVPGYLAPEAPTGHPEGVVEELRAELGEYRIYPPHGHDADRGTVISNYRDLVDSRGRAFRYLFRQLDPDFGFLEFQATDSVVHELGGDLDAVETIYRAVDREIDAVLESCDPDTVFLVSDHGIGPYEAYSFHVNEFLKNRGYVETVSGRAGGMPSWGTIHERARVADSKSARVGRALSRATLVGARAGLTSQRMYRILDRVGLAETVAQVVPSEAIRSATEQVDFERSVAYMRSRTELGVRINLAGRDPEGRVSPDEYETVRKELIEALSDVRTPDGDRVFEAVLPREAVFSGPYLDDSVDIVTIPHEFEQFLSARLGEEFGEPEEPWNHKREGIIAASGVGIDTEASLSGATLFDVAPTVLASLGVPHDDRMDGAVLPVARSVGTTRYSGGETPRPTESATVEERLSQLGYLDR